VSFFEPPPPPPEPPEPASVRRPWFGPPDNIRGGVVALELTVGRSDKAAITVAAATVYPDGFEFGLAIRIRDAAGDQPLDPLFFHHRHRRSGQAIEGLPPELARFGIEFSDGRKATNLQLLPLGEESPEGPVLIPGGGGGGGSRWEQSCWVWPLPPPGALAFVCEWPVADINLSRVEIDASLILAAASRAQVLWQPETGSGGTGSSGYGVAVAVRADAKTITQGAEGKLEPEPPNGVAGV
jgi:hypothetical protein